MIYFILNGFDGNDDFVFACAAELIRTVSISLAD